MLPFQMFLSEAQFLQRSDDVPRRGQDHEEVLHPERRETAQQVLNLRQHASDVLAALDLDDPRRRLELTYGHHVALLVHLGEALAEERFQLRGTGTGCITNHCDLIRKSRYE